MANYKVDKISIRGFRSIKELNDFELKKVNVLIGPNGAGKSNFIELFKLVQAISEGNLQKYIFEYGSPSGFFHKGVSDTSEINFSFVFGRNSYSCSLGVSAENKMYILNDVAGFSKKYEGTLDERVSRKVSSRSMVNDKDASESTISQYQYESQLFSSMNSFSYSGGNKEVISYVYNSINGWRLYHFNETGKKSKLRQPANINDHLELYGDGRNIAPVLMNLRDEYPRKYQTFKSVMDAIAPFFGDFVFEPEKYGNGEKVVNLSWRHKNSKFMMQPYHLSDGTLRFIALIACLLQPKPPTTIVIDEPELGLHPYAIEYFVGIAKSKITAQQIILATQSPYLINNLDAADIITVNNHGDGTQFARLEEEPLKEWLEDYSLGELWYKNVITASP